MRRFGAQRLLVLVERSGGVRVANPADIGEQPRIGAADHRAFAGRDDQVADQADPVGIDAEARQSDAGELGAARLVVATGSVEDGVAEPGREADGDRSLGRVAPFFEPREFGGNTLEVVEVARESPRRSTRASITGAGSASIS